MNTDGDSLQVRWMQYGAVGLALVALFVLAQKLTSASEELHAERAVTEFREGRFAENRGDCKAAAEHYRIGLELADDPTYRLALARCLIKEGRSSEGGTYLSQVLAADPTSGEANLLRAELLTQAGAVDDAVLFYERSATGSWPLGDTKGRYRARRELADLLYSRQRWRELLPQLMQLAEAGESADVQKMLGQTHLTLRQPRQALAALRTAARLAPEDPTVANDLAFAQAVTSMPAIDQARVALARLKRCGAFEEQFVTEAEATLRRRNVEEARLRELTAAMWERSGPTCAAESKDERVVAYVLAEAQ